MAVRTLQPVRLMDAWLADGFQLRLNDDRDAIALLHALPALLASLRAWQAAQCPQERLSVEWCAVARKRGFRMQMLHGLNVRLCVHPDAAAEELYELVELARREVEVFLQRSHIALSDADADEDMTVCHYPTERSLVSVLHRSRAAVPGAGGAVTYVYPALQGTVDAAKLFEAIRSAGPCGLALQLQLDPPGTSRHKGAPAALALLPQDSEHAAQLKTMLAAEEAGEAFGVNAWLWSSDENAQRSAAAGIKKVLAGGGVHAVCTMLPTYGRDEANAYLLQYDPWAANAWLASPGQLVGRLSSMAVTVSLEELHMLLHQPETAADEAAPIAVKPDDAAAAAGLARQIGDQPLAEQVAAVLRGETRQAVQEAMGAFCERLDQLTAAMEQNGRQDHALALSALEQKLMGAMSDMRTGVIREAGEMIGQRFDQLEASFADLQARMEQLPDVGSSLSEVNAAIRQMAKDTVAEQFTTEELNALQVTSEEELKTLRGMTDDEISLMRSAFSFARMGMDAKSDQNMNAYAYPITALYEYMMQKYYGPGRLLLNDPVHFPYDPDKYGKYWNDASHPKLAAYDYMSRPRVDHLANDVYPQGLGNLSGYSRRRYWTVMLNCLQFMRLARNKVAHQNDLFQTDDKQPLPEVTRQVLSVMYHLLVTNDPACKAAVLQTKVGGYAGAYLVQRDETVESLIDYCKKNVFLRPSLLNFLLDLNKTPWVKEEKQELLPVLEPQAQP